MSTMTKVSDRARSLADALPLDRLREAVASLERAVAVPHQPPPPAPGRPTPPTHRRPVQPHAVPTGPVAETAPPRPRIGGVAPNVRPPTRWDRFRQGRLLEQRGFVPLSPGRAKRRHRILPRTVIGISFMLMSLGIGAAFAGAAFYAYYDNRLAANEAEISRFVDGFDQQFVDASDSLNELRAASLEQIRDELAPLDEYVTEQNGVVDLPAQIGRSVFQLRTRDESGRAIAGSAAAVAEHPGGTAFVTSYRLVRSGTIAPAPAIELVKGDETIPAILWSWDPERDLALVVAEVDVEPLTFATAGEQTAAVGARVFAMSGTGGQGSTASPGTVLDRSAVGLQHTAAVGTLFNGGPLVDSRGRLLGVASVHYRPLGVDGGAVTFAPDLAGLCARLLNCADPSGPEATGDGQPGG